MAFILEDGTGVVNANAYISVSYFRSYFSDRGITFSETDTQIEYWIVQATDYMELIYASLWPGSKLTETQSLHFPASDAYTRTGVLLPEDEVPALVQKACAEYASRVKQSPLSPDPTLDANGLLIMTTREKVGELEVHYGSVTGKPGPQNRYPSVVALLSPLLPYSSGTVIR